MWLIIIQDKGCHLTKREKTVQKREKRTINYLTRLLSPKWINSSANLNNYCTCNWPSGWGQNSVWCTIQLQRSTFSMVGYTHVFTTELMSFSDKVVRVCMYAFKLSYQSEIWQLSSELSSSCPWEYPDIGHRETVGEWPAQTLNVPPLSLCPFISAPLTKHTGVEVG